MAAEVIEADGWIEAPALWQAVDRMHEYVDEDTMWASNLNLDPAVHAQVVERLRMRSAHWIAEHMEVLVRAPVD